MIKVLTSFLQVDYPIELPFQLMKREVFSWWAYRDKQMLQCLQKKFPFSKKSYRMIQYHFLSTGYPIHCSYLARLTKVTKVLNNHHGFCNSLWSLSLSDVSPVYLMLPQNLPGVIVSLCSRWEEQETPWKFTGNPDIFTLIQNVLRYTVSISSSKREILGPRFFPRVTLAAVL